MFTFSVFDLPFLDKFGPKNQNCQFDVFTFSVFDQKSYIAQIWSKSKFSV